MTITVYMESRSHAEVVAIFEDEVVYNACVGGLMKLAQKQGLVLTENIDGFSMKNREANDERNN